MPVKQVRILVADDHEVVRQGVRALLEEQPGWTVCGEVSTGRDAVAKAVELRPDVVVLDVGMPELNGLEAMRQIRRVVPAKVLILTVHESDRMVAEVLDAGAHGYVLKRDAGRTLVEAIRALLGRREFVSEGVQDAATLARREPIARLGAGRLSPREREVLQLLAEGRTNKEISAALGMSTKTAEKHREHIFAKLNLHSISELVRYAIRNGIIEP